ncbi:MAG: hypothetical protein ABJQ34_06945 [Paracoccaceae bacterium]
MATYEVRLMFEWGGGCLWGMNEAAKALYGYAEIERVLPISLNIKNKLDELSELHDKALNWGDPAGPSPWGKSDFDLFEIEALSVLNTLQTELGDSFSVWYRPLGEASPM